MGKQYWAEVLSYASTIVKMLPFLGVDYKTPMEVWTGSHASYDSLHIFGCPAYYHVREDKIGPRIWKAIFMGSRSGVKGYKLWCL